MQCNFSLWGTWQIELVMHRAMLRELTRWSRIMQTSWTNQSFLTLFYVRIFAVTTCLRKCKSQNQGCHHCCKVSSCQQLQSNSVKRAVLPALQPAYSYFFISHNKNSNPHPLCPKNPYIFISNHLENFLMTVRSAFHKTIYILHTYTVLQNYTQHYENKFTKLV